MKSTLFNRLRGYVRIELRGGQLERLLNRLIEQRFAIWDIRRIGGEAVELHILIRDFFRLRPFLKQTATKLRIRGRFGFPFMLDRLGRRKAFLIGIVCFFVAIFVLSMLVWRIDVEGNEKIARSDIVQAAKEQGIYRFQWKFRLPDSDKLSRELLNKLPGTAWVGVDVQGTRIRIKVVESARPEDRPLMSPRHLVASKNALVTQILAERGKPLVKVNSNVNKGDILISGYVGDDVNRQTVVAQGTVRGIVWEEANVEIPLTLTRKVYTGETKKRSYVVIGNKALQVSGFGEPSFAQFETIPLLRTLQWRKWSLPIGMLNEKLLESRIEEIPLDPEDAKKIALEQARAELVAAAGPEAKWRSEKIILHEKSDNGKVYMKVLFEIEQPIAMEQPIVP
ncbi:sporulation protein YqfD [Paenibacillus ginsengarvi]|uniref:Sporulation protein YqfD n=1 Tax=Paenibacillus ginsengarvi TaxID=400777 RepID=A0A3B0CXF2_9BACL|nr:sporulation protein YqfD [Paenibacillus ginsengarvi]RKN86957.1 sporulation protein YqfD [Paenibacillus ginsengarvi]